MKHPERFRLRFGHAIWLGLPWLLLFGPPLFWFLRVIAPRDTPTWLINLVAWGGIVGVVIFSLAAFLGLAFYNSVWVAREGLTAFSLWGLIPTTVPWGNITAAHSTRYLGLPYLRLTIEGKTSNIWLPRFLHRQVDFDHAVLSVLPAGNPLRTKLEDPNGTAREGAA